MHTVAERRVAAMRSPEVDGLRRLLCFEPRGHADMYGGFITPPDDAGADLGVLFWHKDGFSTACGHGTIALGVWALESRSGGAGPERRHRGRRGRAVGPGDGPGAHRRRTGSPPWTSSTWPAIWSRSRCRCSTSRGTAYVDVGFGGAIYAMLDADVARALG